MPSNLTKATTPKQVAATWQCPFNFLLSKIQQNVNMGSTTESS